MILNFKLFAKQTITNFIQSYTDTFDWLAALNDTEAGLGNVVNWKYIPNPLEVVFGRAVLLGQMQVKSRVQSSLEFNKDKSKSSLKQSLNLIKTTPSHMPSQMGQFHCLESINKSHITSQDVTLSSQPLQ